MKKSLYWLVVVLGSTLSASSSLANGFTIEQVLSSPYPSGLVAAPRAPRIAWIFDDKGERNVWVADAPDFTPRQITHYKGDDGQAIASLRLTPDGATVIYARGSEVNPAMTHFPCELNARIYAETERFPTAS